MAHFQLALQLLAIVENCSSSRVKLKGSVLEFQYCLELRPPHCYYVHVQERKLGHSCQLKSQCGSLGYGATQ